MLDGLRKRRRTLEDLDFAAVESAPAPEEVEEASPKIRGLDELPFAQRQGIELRYGMELSFEEIAAKLETTPSNARQIISRAVRALKRAAQRGGQNENS